MSQQADDFERPHAGFQKSLRASVYGVAQVVAWLNRRSDLEGKGFRFRLLPVSVAPTRREAAAYSDHGDIEITAPDGSKGRGEVKHITYDFTDEHWPHGNNFLICNQHSFDNADPKPIAYWTLSPDCKYVAEVNVSHTRKHWYKREVRDKRTGEVQMKYACLKKHVTFRRIDR